MCSDMYVVATQVVLCLALPALQASPSQVPSVGNPVSTGLSLWICIQSFCCVVLPLKMRDYSCLIGVLVHMCGYPYVHTCTCILNSIVLRTVQGGLSPLYVASEFGNTEVVDALLKSGANPNLATTVWGLVCSYHLLHGYCVLVHCPTSNRADST